MAFVQPDAEPTAVGLELLDARGGRMAFVDVAAGANPTRFADPVVAALPDGSFAVAWNDLNSDGSELGVGLRRVYPDGTTGFVEFANEVAFAAQFDADLIWTGSELVAAWTDTSDPLNGPDILVRRFDAELTPLNGEMVLGGTAQPEGNVALAAMNGSWIGAWRRGEADGQDSIVVATAEEKWTIPNVGQPGPASDRPALIALDPSHLFVAYTVGIDGTVRDGNTGVITPRLHAAVVDLEDGTVQTLGSVEALDSAFAGATTIGQTGPTATAVGGRFYLGWHSESPLGDARGEEVWLKRIYWDPASEFLDLSVSEVLAPRAAAHTAGDQRDLALTATSLVPEGALLLAWTDFGLGLDANQGAPDVVAQLAPVPILRGPGKETDCSTSPCSTGIGPCADDSECVSGHVCAEGRGPWYGYGPTTAVCVPAHCENGAEDAGSGETGVDCGGDCGTCFECPREENGEPLEAYFGLSGFCSAVCPCAPFEGDCDSDTDCRGDLACVEDVGARRIPPFEPEIDICLQAECTDGVRNGGETRIDCGGPDCAACPVGEANYCVAEACAEGEGDCNESSECLAGLSCVEGEGPRYGLDDDVNVCFPDACIGATGAPDDPSEAYCTATCRCGAGVGHCQTDAGCLDGLVCEANAGLAFNKASGVGVCVPEHCTNLALDGDETNYDCGGSCGSCPVCPVDGRVASFEHPDQPWGYASWYTPGEGVVLGHSTDATHGSESLELAACNWIQLTSPTFSTTDFRYVGNELLLDVYVPPNEELPNIYWAGGVHLRMDLPAAGFTDVLLEGSEATSDGRVDLTPLPRGEWSTISFVVPENIEAEFHQVHDDLALRLALSASYCPGAAPTYRFDNLRFGGDLVERSLCGEDPDGTGGTGGSGGTGGTGGAGGTGGTGGGTGGTGGSTGGTGGTGGYPGGYFVSGDWAGYGWTATDGSSGSTIVPDNFGEVYGLPFCASGNVAAAPDYSGVGIIGVNLNQDFVAGSPIESVWPRNDGVTVTVTNVKGSDLRLQVNGPNGATDANDRWCAPLGTASGTYFVPWSNLNTRCWDNSGAFYTGQAIVSAQLLVPGSNTTDIEFDFCMDALAETNSSGEANFCSSTPLQDTPPFALNQLVSPDGSESYPYPICTVAQLQSVVNDTNLWDAHFELRTDIDISTLSGTIGSGPEAANSFTGTFDGRGHTLSGFTAQTAGDYVGLFGSVVGDGVLDGLTDGHILNLTVENATVSGGSYVGALVGSVNLGRIENCHAVGGTVEGTTQFVGGLVGWIARTSASDSSSSVDVTGDGAKHVGGFVGSIRASSSVVSSTSSGTVQALNGADYIGGFAGGILGAVDHCSSSASVSGGDQMVGGFVGNAPPGGSISGSYAVGNVNAPEGTNVGGFLGYSNNDIIDSYAIGDVVAYDSVGGFGGAIEGGGSAEDCFATGNATGLNAGGFVNSLANSSLQRCFAAGDVIATGGGHKGGLVGRADGAQITDCFAEGAVDGGAGGVAGGLIGRLWNQSTIKNTYSVSSVTGSGATLGAFLGSDDGTGSTIYGSFFDADVVTAGLPAVGEGTPAVSDVTGKTTAEMQSKATFDAAGWNFTHVWSLDGSPTGYPQLRQMGAAPMAQAWTPATTVDVGDADVRNPVVGVDDSGNVLALWVQSDGTAESLYFSRYEAGVWSAPALVETEDGPLANHWSGLNPALKVLPSGDAIAAWAQDDAFSISAVYAAWFDGATGTWSTPQILDSGVGDAYTVSVDVASNGVAVVTWQQSNGTALSIYASRYEPATGLWDAATLLEQNDAGTAYTPEVVVDANGNAFVAWWQDTVGGGGYFCPGCSAYVARYDVSTGAWGAPYELDLNSTGYGRWPQLAVDASGNAMAVWYEEMDPSSGEDSDWNALASRYDVSNDTWSAPVRLSPSAGLSVWTDVAMDAAGNAIVAYAHRPEFGGRPDAFVNHYDVATDSWSLPVKFTETPQDVGDVRDTRIDMDSAGNAVVTWFDTVDYNDRYLPKAMYYDAALGEWVGQTLLDSDPSYGVYSDYSYGRTVDVADGGHAAAVWPSWNDAGFWDVRAGVLE